MSTDQLRQRVQKLIAEKNTTITAVAKDTGYGPSAISQWLSGSYKADTTRIHSAVEAFLNRLEGGEDVGYIATETASTIEDVCETTIEEGALAALVGNPGVGKTYALKRFAREQNRPRPKSKIAAEIEQHTDPRPVRRVVYYQVIFRMRAKTLLQEIARLLDVSPNGTVADIARRLIEKIRRDPTLLIIDEANHLDVPCLETLRHLHDQTGVGMLLAGTRQLTALFTGGGKREMDLEQLSTRVDHWIEVSGCKPLEMRQILTRAFGDDVRDDVIIEFNERCGTSMRAVSKLVQRTRKILDMTRSPLSPAIVRRAAAKTLIGRAA
jgi:DNA transposition AAA+ family ATPase